ncbi:MAG: glycosyltransferase family 39 protein [Acidobacteria bacterium]|nr:glycosyltransferase family 39 protein [Acidobacteriota bacterium]MBS1865566.1 glycosyltransferase family 39 protein [Acidobacteriota bacterium]
MSANTLETTTKTHESLTDHVDSRQGQKSGQRMEADLETAQTARNLPKGSALRGFVIFAATWVTCSVFVGMNLMRGWVPWDDGLLAQCAERVLQGQLPHRDFTDVYTGGLSFLYAASFRILGTNLDSIRWTLLLFTIFWIAAIYFLAKEVFTDWIAAGITLLAVAWSVPNYPAGLPSWYNLFFATFGAVCLFVWLKKPSAWWLFGAGICGGLSFLIKSIALFYIAAVLLVFLFVEQTRSQTVRKKTPAYTAFLCTFLFATIAALAFLIRGQLGLPEIVHYFLPAAAIARLLVRGEFSGSSLGGSSVAASTDSGSSSERFHFLGRMIWPFFTGFAAPLLLFLLPYIHAHALGALFNGVFVLPAKRILAVAIRQPPLIAFLPAIALFIAIVLGFYLKDQARRIWTLLFFAVLAFVFMRAFLFPSSYQAIWKAAHGLIPITVLAGTAAIIHYGRDRRSVRDYAQERVFILIALSAFCSLVQFPYAASIYFCYIAPLGFLAAALVIGLFRDPPRILLSLVVVTGILFGAVVMLPGGLFWLGRGYFPDSANHKISLPRAGNIRISAISAETYSNVIPFVRQHARGNTILAGPDCPEIYFLGGFRNPTPTMYEVFEDRASYPSRIQETIRANDINVVVVNLAAIDSYEYVRPLRAIASTEFKFSSRVGKFEVWWK